MTTKYILISIGKSDGIIDSLKDHTFNFMCAVDTLAEARFIKDGIDLLNESNFKATDENPQYVSPLKIITIEEK